MDICIYRYTHNTHKHAYIYEITKISIFCIRNSTDTLNRAHKHIHAHTRITKSYAMTHSYANSHLQV